MCSLLCAVEDDIGQCASSAVDGYKTWSSLSCYTRAKVLLRYVKLNANSCAAATISTSTCACVCVVLHRILPVCLRQAIAADNEQVFLLYFLRTLSITGQ